MVRKPLVLMLGTLVIASIAYIMYNHSASECMDGDRFSDDGRAAYHHLIRNLGVRVVDLTAPSDLFMFAEFIEVYEDPGAYVPYAVSVVSSASFDPVEREIAMYSMSKLPSRCFVEFARYCYQSYRAGVLSAEELYWVRVFSFGSNRPFSDSMHPDDAKALVDTIMSDESISKTLRNELRSTYGVGS